jgi:uncharacterized protein involved in cysteine biosynthesis
MTLIQQLQLTARSFKSLLLIRKHTLLWLAIYLVAGLAVFSIVTHFLLENQDHIKKLLLNYFFPESWHTISEILANVLFESQAKTVIGNMIIGASLVVASIFLFPIKEKCSEVFEINTQLLEDKPEELTLIQQAWEETKLLLIYLTAQVVILFIGYYPYAGTKFLSVALSYLFLFFTFGLDFIAPTLQRHRMTYNAIIKSLSKRFFTTSSFGLIFSLPVVILGHWVLSQDNYTLIEASSLLFFVNILLFTLAIPVGTYIASQVFPLVKQTSLTNPVIGKAAWSILIATLIVGLFLHGQLIKSIHNKSQLLKANYSPDWSTIDFKGPSFSEIMSGKLLGGFSMDMQITNPTQFDILVEDTYVMIKKSDYHVARVEMTGFDVLAQQEKTIKLEFESMANLPSFNDIKNLSLNDLKNLSLDKINPEELMEGWRVDLYIRIWPGIPFILNIYE